MELRTGKVCHHELLIRMIGEDGDVILWDVRQAAAAETLSGHARSAFSPQIADHGKTLYTASLDGTLNTTPSTRNRTFGFFIGDLRWL